jgi:hypothetical protein
LSENSKYLGLLKDNHIIRKRLDELLESEWQIINKHSVKLNQIEEIKIL